AGTDRAHADGLRARRLPAKLAAAVRLPAPRPASSRFGYGCWLRRIHPSDRVSAGGQSLRPQHLDIGVASPVLAGRQGWFVFVAAGPTLSGGDSRRGAV